MNMYRDFIKWLIYVKKNNTTVLRNDMIIWLKNYNHMNKTRFSVNTIDQYRRLLTAAEYLSSVHSGKYYILDSVSLAEKLSLNELKKQAYPTYYENKVKSSTRRSCDGIPAVVSDKEIKGSEYVYKCS